MRLNCGNYQLIWKGIRSILVMENLNYRFVIGFDNYLEILLLQNNMVENLFYSCQSANANQWFLINHLRLLSSIECSSFERIKILSVIEYEWHFQFRNATKELNYSQHSSSYCTTQNDTLWNWTRFALPIFGCFYKKKWIIIIIIQQCCLQLIFNQTTNYI